MKTFLLFLVVFVFAYWRWSKNRQPTKAKPEPPASNKPPLVPIPRIEVVVSTSVESPRGSTPDTPETGIPTSSAEGVWVVNPNSTFPLALYKMERAQAEEAKRVLDTVYGKGIHEARQKFAELIVQWDIRCVQVDEYVSKYKPIYHDLIERLKQDSTEWATASENDREDLLATFSEEASSKLDVKLGCDIEVLFDFEPSDASIDDVLISRYGYKTASSYVSHLGRGNKARIIPVDHYERDGFEKLVQAGLAVRGDEIETQAILGLLKLKDLKDMVSDSQPPAIRKKTDAVAFASGLPDIKERLARVLTLRELFQIKPLPIDFAGLDLSKITNAWRYAHEVAWLITHTYMSAGYTVSSKRGDEEDLKYVSGWEVSCADEETSCAMCRRVSSKGFPKNRYPRVPLHLGCRCVVLSKTAN